MAVWVRVQRLWIVWWDGKIVAETQDGATTYAQPNQPVEMGIVCPIRGGMGWIFLPSLTPFEALGCKEIAPRKVQIRPAIES